MITHRFVKLEFDDGTAKEVDLSEAHNEEDLRRILGEHDIDLPIAKVVALMSQLLGDDDGDGTFPGRQSTGGFTG